MTDLIDRDALINALNELAMEHHESHVPLVEHDFRELIRKAEPVQPAEEIISSKEFEHTAETVRNAAEYVAVAMRSLVEKINDNE